MRVVRVAWSLFLSAAAAVAAAPLPQVPPASPPPWTLQLQVLDANNEPVADAAIELCEPGAKTPFLVGRSDAEGNWQGQVAAAECFARAEQAECGRSIAVFCQPDTSGVRQELLMLVRPVVVSGLVLGEDGKPWPATGVNLRFGAKSPLRGPAFSMQPIVTDENGEFSFEAAAATVVELSLIADGYHRGPLVVAADGARIVLLHRRAALVRGTVVDAERRPVAASVRLEPIEANVAAPAAAGEVPVRLGADGALSSDIDAAEEPPAAAPEFAFEPERLGRYRVFVSPVGMPPKFVDVELTAAAPKQELTIEVAPGVRTDGVVVGATAGQMVATALADARCKVTAEISATGEFHCDLPAGTGWRLVTPEGLVRQVQAGERGVRIEPTSASEPAEHERSERPLRVEVLNGDGKPAQLSVVRWLEADANEFVSFAADGHRIVTNLAWPQPPQPPAAPRRLVVGNYKSGEAAVLVIPADHPPRMELRLHAPVEVTVSVLRAGKPARGVAVEVVDCMDPERAPVRDGKATVRAFPGPATLCVRRGRETLLARPVEIPAAAVAFSVELQ